MARNTITVIMSVHNSARYLREAISSILNQTLKEFEFIIVNDASTDESESIINSFNDPRIKIIKNEQNIGLTKSLNIALQKSTGTYIARMDADDIALPERLTVQKNFLDTHPDIAVISSAVTVIDEDNKTIGRKRVVTDPYEIGFRLLIINQMTHPSIMMRASVIKKNMGYNEDFVCTQDYELWSRLNNEGYLMSNIEKTLLLYRLHGKSVTQSKENLSTYLAKKTAKNNIQKYLPLNEEDSSLFFTYFYEHKIDSFFNLLKLRRAICKLEENYIQKKNISLERAQHIRRYVMFERGNMVRWYLRKYVKLIKHIWQKKH